MLVADIKHQAALLIDQIADLQTSSSEPAVMRWCAEAITNIETGAMFAVKAAVAQAEGGSLHGQLADQS